MRAESAARASAGWRRTAALVVMAAAAVGCSPVGGAGGDEGTAPGSAAAGGARSGEAAHPGRDSTVAARARRSQEASVTMPFAEFFGVARQAAAAREAAWAAAVEPIW
ncbi:MAG: hypothetical protein LBG60_16100, partial [Bifidobacteriaceae bacterium]|nr:hypothetical protein [Bifidobacteriaceae bacterium]